MLLRFAQIRISNLRLNPLLLVTVAVAIFLRVGVALFLGDTTPIAKDETSYSVLAARVADGNGFSFPVAWYPFANPGAPTSHWSFLYTALVAAVYSIVGTHPIFVRVLQAIICGILMPVLTYRLSQRIFPNTSQYPFLPLLSALLAALYAYFVLYGAMVQTEALFFCVVIWSLEQALAVDSQIAANIDRRKLSLAALSLGISLGLATLLRQSILPWVPVLCLWLLFTGWRAKILRSAVVAVTIVVATVTLCILPFTLRNYLVYGDFLLLNSNAGFAMYSAQHPMHGTHFQPYAAAPLPADLIAQGLNEAQWDRALLQRGIAFVLAEPNRYLLLSLSRLSNYFEFLPEAKSSLLFNAGQLASFSALFPFMLIGIYLALKNRAARRRNRVLVLLPDPVVLSLLFVIFYTLLHILTWAMARYRLPVDAVLLPYAALGLVSVAHIVANLIGIVHKRTVKPLSAPKE